MKLVSDYSKYTVSINNIQLSISPDTLKPFNISAVVEEQDVSLILSKPKSVVQPIDQPVWYLAHKVETQPMRVPGSVVVWRDSPLRLLAIVHDFDFDPSWKAEWIEQALNNILQITVEKQLQSIKLPVLGMQFGRFGLKHFLDLLTLALKRYQPECLRRIWLVIPPELCESTYFTLLDMQKTS